MKYPEHLSDETRLTIADQQMVKEFGKLFPTMPSEQIRFTVNDWRQSPAQYRFEESLQDYWDTFAAVFESIKLKPSFTAFITAANYHWQKEQLEVNSIRFSSQLDQLTRIPGLAWHDGMTVSEVTETAHNANVIDEQRAINDRFSGKDEQNSYPIIARRTPDGVVQVMDGNRRILRAGLYDKSHIEAWVADADGEMPRDFWVPVNDLFQIVKYYRIARTDSEKQSVRNTLELLFASSSVARINYNRRVAGNKWADELLAIKPGI